MSVDDKVISASLETTQFTKGASDILKQLQKINETLTAMGKVNGLDNIEKSASRVNFLGISSAIDKLKGKFTFREADQGFSDIEKSASRVNFLGIGTAIDKVKSLFRFPEADQAFSDVEKSSARVTFQGIGRAIDGVASHFSVLEGAAAVAFGNIATRAISSGAQAAKGLSISPVTDGLSEYETQLNAVQTILSNTAASGATLRDVNKALNELNHYSDKTIYNFTEMAKNIGTFTAAGVDLKTSTESIKGIANLAALSGSNSQQASTAMYQLSQAISAGRVSLQDWNSVMNAGLGGAVFQRALAQTAEQMGTLKDGAVKLSGKMKNVTIDGKSFRESITAKPGEQSWLTSRVLTNTLKQLSGDMSDAQLKAQGYSDAQIKAIQTQARMAVNAATQVKTLSGVLDTAKEALGSGWAQTWQLVFGDFGQAKTLFTGMSNSINAMISNSANARNSLLKDWAKLGGRTDLIAGIKNVFIALGSVLKPIREAFRDIFPPTTGAELADITKRFRDFTENLKIGPETADKLKRAFTGVFSVLDIGKQIIVGVFHVIGDLFGAVGDGSGGFLDLAANIGDWLHSLDESLKKGKGLTHFFEGLSGVLQTPIRLLSALGTAIVGVFGGFDKGDADNVNKSLGSMKDHLGPLKGLIDGLSSAWDGFTDSMSQLGDRLGPAINSIGDAFGDLGSSVASGLAHTDWSQVFDAIQVGLLGGIFVLIRRFFSKGVTVNVGQGILGSISESFEALTGSLTAMQQNLKANTLLKIAGAIGLLTASVVALSLINGDSLKKALTAMAVGFGQLLGAMAILTNISGSAGFLKVPFISASLILLAGAIDVMVLAVAGLSRLSWDDLIKGLTGVGALLVGISAASGPLSANSAGLIRAGVGIAALGVALNILALAVLAFGHMDWTTIGKGLAGVAGSLTVVGAASNLFPTGMLAIGAGLLLVGGALTVLAGAMKIFATMKWEDIGKGLATTAGALVIIAGAMQLMPPSMILQAAGLVLVGTALNIIAGALKIMGSSSPEEIAKGLGTLAGALLILAAGLSAMTGSLAGAAALVVASAALTMLVPALKVLGGMSWDEIVHGMVALAGAFAVLGVAGLVLAPVAPALLALGAALLLIGGGFTLVGAGLTLISTAISALAVAGPAGVKLLVSAMVQLAQAIPTMVTAFVTGLVTMVQKIAEVAPQFVQAIGVILVNLANAVIAAAPVMGQAMSAVILAALATIRSDFPVLVTTGLGMLTALLGGIKNNIGKVVSQVGSIVVNFLNALNGKLPQILTAGTNLLTTLLRGVASSLPKVIRGAADVITSFLSGVSSNIGRVAAGAVQVVAHFISGIASRLGDLVSSGGKIMASVISGIASGAGRMVSAAATAAGKFISSLAKAFLRLTDEGARAVITLMNGIADAINKYEPQAIAAGGRIGAALITGMISGITANIGKAASAIGGAVGGLVSKAKHAAGIKSPSTVFAEIGDYMMQGLALGIGSDTSALGAMSTMSYGLINGIKSIFQIQSPSKVMHDIGQFVGQGFAEGLVGSKDDIDGAFTDLNNKVTDAMTTLRTTIATENENLKKLRDARKPDEDAIAKAKDALKANKDALAELVATHGYLGTALAKTTTALDGEQITLKGLALKYADIVTQLDAANQALDDAMKKRDDFEKSTSDQFSALPDIEMVDKDGNPIDPATQVTNWVQAIQNQQTAVATYSDTLEQLRRLGLDDATYQKLLTDGTADQAFASQLLSGGKTAVDGLNQLDAQLQVSSAKLATNAARNLYQAGVDSAQGIVDGLNSQKSKISKAMEAIATAMIKAIKRKLHIKSPSKAFAEVGRFSSLGVAEGIKAASRSVTEAAEAVGDDALSAMQRSMSHISDALSTGIDSNPTITPVLDLTQLKKDAQQLSDLSNVVPISAATSYGQAAAITQDQFARQTADDPSAGREGTVLQFEQNNHSPEALSDVEIYRNTKNLLSLAKDALASR